jgi:DNA primase
LNERDAGCFVGFNETVACQGTALTHEHLRKLNALTHQILLVFDGDEPGQKAALKVLDHAFNFPEVHFKIALLPLKEDPDSLLRKNGPQAIEAVLEKSEDLLDFAIRHKIKNAPQTGLADLIAKSIVPWLQQVTDPLRRAVLIQKISQETRISPDLLLKSSRTVLNTPVKAVPLKSSETASTPNDEAPIPPLEKEFIGHLFFAQAHQVPLDEIRELLFEHMELPGSWLDFAKELFSCLQNKESPETKNPNDWQTGSHPAIKKFLEEIPSRKNAFATYNDMSPFSRIRLETKKKNLRKTLDVLKKKTISLKMEKVDDPQLWGQVTHSLVRTTQELQSVDLLLRKSSSQA